MLIGAAILVATLVALLAVPLGVQFELAWHGQLAQRVDLVWAFGLVRIRLAPADEPRRAMPRSARKARKKPRPPASRRRAHLLAALRLKPFRRRMLRFAVSLWRAIRKERVMLDVRLGLDDPADTGRLWALGGPVAGLAQRLPDVAVSLEPDFHEASFELDSSGTLRVVPLELVWIVAALLVSPAFWHGVRAARRGA